MGTFENLGTALSPSFFYHHYTHGVPTWTELEMSECVERCILRCDRTFDAP